MARCIKKYECQKNGEIIMRKISEYLFSQGYKFEKYDGELVYHKGNGFISSPLCFKVYRSDTHIIIEGWMKWALLPLIAIGEIDYSKESVLGAIPRKKMQKDAAFMEYIIRQYEYTASEAAGTESTQWNEVSRSQTLFKNQGFESQNKDAQNVEKTGAFSERMPEFENRLQRPDIDERIHAVTKSEYIKNYADEKLIKDIKKTAIVGYVCSGITAAFGIAMRDVGVIAEVLIMLGLLLGMHLGKKKWCAVAYLCLAVIDCMVSIAYTGTLSGWLVIVVGIWAVITFNKIDKNYKIFSKKV